MVGGYTDLPLEVNGEDAKQPLFSLRQHLFVYTYTTILLEILPTMLRMTPQDTPAHLPVELHGNVVGKLAPHAEDDSLRAFKLVDVHHHFKRDLIEVQPANDNREV
jgi:hypothetical protein